MPDENCWVVTANLLLVSIWMKANEISCVKVGEHINGPKQSAKSCYFRTPVKVTRTGWQPMEFHWSLPSSTTSGMSRPRQCIDINQGLDYPNDVQGCVLQRRQCYFGFKPNPLCSPLKGGPSPLCPRRRATAGQGNVVPRCTGEGQKRAHARHGHDHEQDRADAQTRTRATGVCFRSILISGCHYKFPFEWRMP